MKEWKKKKDTFKKEISNNSNSDALNFVKAVSAKDVIAKGDTKNHAS